MPGIAVVILGHSHTGAVVNALADRPVAAPPGSAAITYHVVQANHRDPDFQFAVPDAQRGFVLNPVIGDKVEAATQGRTRVWVSMFGGNAHNALTLLEHPRPFDLILPQDEQLPRIAEAELLPVAYVERFISGLAQLYILFKICLRNAVDGDILHVESPPPIGDDRFVAEHLETYFCDQRADPRVAPRVLRYKLWRVHSALIRQACEANDIAFLGAPPETQDGDGFLVPRAYADDSTHAGPWYGLQVLRQIEARYGLPYGGWGWIA